MRRKSQDLILTGEVNDLFSHMALWGIARISKDAGIRRVRGRWTDEADPSPVLAAEVDTPMEIARAVKEHAQIRATNDSWLHQGFSPDPQKSGYSVALLAPRTAAPLDAESWRRLESRRTAILDDLPSLIDGELLLGFGYRSWWVTERNGAIRADKGCSLWEMRTRNKGTDVVADRLLPLARDIADWPEQKILDGLIGSAVDDSTGGNKPESRTSTGFRLPGPVDSARAWCALWALSLFPAVASTSDGAASPASAQLPQGSGARHVLLVPVSPTPLSVDRLAMLARSETLVAAASTGHRRMEPAAGARDRVVERASALSHLRERGIVGVMQFPVRVVGSASAPERQALSGTLVAS